MKFALLAIVALLSLIGALALATYLLGRSLPAAHIAQGERVIDAPLAHVAARVREVELQPAWRRGVTRIEVERRADGFLRYGEISGRDRIVFELREPQPQHRFESRIVSQDLPFGGRWLIDLDSMDANHTRVHVREEGVIHSPLFRALARYVFGHTRTLDTYLAELAASFSKRPHGG